MPRTKQKVAFLGEQTVRILLGVPQKQAGWLIRALCDWIENDREPQNVPADCIGSWIAIHDESVRIHDSRRQQIEAGRAGAEKTNGERAAKGRRKSGERTANDGERAAKGRQDKDISASADISAVEKKEDINRRPQTAVPQTRTPAREDAARIKATSYDTWAQMQDDPVDVALDATGEGPEKRKVYGARLRKLGRDRFLETVCAFRAEVAAGEPVRNTGAALTKRLNDAADAKAAMEAIA